MTSFCARSSDSRVVRPALPEVVLALQVLPREVEGCARLVYCGSGQLQRRAGGSHAGLAPLQLPGEGLGIDLEQELAGTDPLAFLYRQSGDAPHGVG